LPFKYTTCGATAWAAAPVEPFLAPPKSPYDDDACVAAATAAAAAGAAAAVKSSAEPTQLRPTRVLGLATGTAAAAEEETENAAAVAAAAAAVGLYRLRSVDP
jgi:hypothetical protein